MFSIIGAPSSMGGPVMQPGVQYIPAGGGLGELKFKDFFSKMLFLGNYGLAQ